MSRAGRAEFELLAGAAADVWHLLDVPRTMDDLVDILTNVYPVSSDVVTADVDSLLDDLVQRGLVEEVQDTDV